MQETSIPSDAGFVVDWQLADDSSRLIDLTTAEPQVLRPDPATIPYLKSTVTTHR